MHEFYIQKTLKLAKKGYGFVSPNPMVGAVIVNHDKIIGQGYHEYFGGPHAEVNAINSVADKSLLVGSTIYVNLQPCSHTGKTPPCSKLIADSGIKKVVYASVDSNVLVSDETLHNAGVEVVSGVLKSKADYLNRKFLHWKSTGRPYISLKVGATLDGMMADSRRKSKWITSDSARNYVYKLRAGYDAILIGSGTLNSDNPNLGLHGISSRKEPLRILISSKVKKFVGQFCRDDNYVILPNFESFWDFCSKNDISSVFVEGGAKVFGYFLNNRNFNELLFFSGPKILGLEGLNWASALLGNTINTAIELDLLSVRRLENTVFSSYLLKK